ncbi:hypothetical protein [Pseudoalteromonas sp. G4]|uniref:hypothetical protein n=1 Tax=Pseudoalteromonas sp. G4 TaxID=2992761 RepID=UPI00237DA47D|nr:hypothetical protein [Pseudoalteromonas sp. G4]MDE3272689.1 hypothetical protein [Pseudoalteromonas sp. G4]
MNLFKSNAWILMRSGTIALPFLLILSVVFSVLWHQKTLDPSSFRYIKTYLLMTCLPSLFLGFMLGIGLQKLKAHYLWVTNEVYRYSILKAGLTVTVIGALCMSLYITFASEVALHYLVLPISFAIIGLFVNSSSSLKYNILRNLACSALLIAMMFQTIHEVAKLIIIASCCYVIYAEFNSSKRSSMSSKSMMLTDRQSVMWWNGKLATFTAKFKKSFNKDIAWSVCYPQTKMGYLGGYFAAILAFVLATNDNELLISFLLLSLVVGCQFPVYQEFSQLKHQLKAIAHTFADKQSVIKGIIYSFDKVVIRNTLFILLAILGVMLFRQDINSAIKITFLTLFASVLFLAFAPLLLIFFNGCINAKNILLFTVICGFEIGIFGLVHYVSEQLSIYLICIAVFITAGLIRYFTQQFVTRQPLERIIN